AASELLIARRQTVHLEPTVFTTDVGDFRAALQAAAGLGGVRPRAEALAAAGGAGPGGPLPPALLNGGARPAGAPVRVLFVGGAAAARPRAGGVGRAHRRLGRGAAGGGGGPAAGGSALRRDAPLRGDRPALRLPAAIRGAGASAARGVGGDALRRSARPG